MKNKKQYSNPTVECVECKVEQGFSVSGDLTQDVPGVIINGDNSDWD